jgi:hypothetical protein
MTGPPGSNRAVHEAHDVPLLEAAVRKLLLGQNVPLGEVPGLGLERDAADLRAPDAAGRGPELAPRPVPLAGA